MFKAKTVNKYAAFVSAFSVIVMILFLFAFLNNLNGYLNPVLADKKEFTYEMITSELFLSSLLLDTREKYFDGIKEEDFEDEKSYLYKIYNEEVQQERPRNALQILVYLVLFAFVFHMHFKLVRDTGGWKKSS